MCTGIFKNEDFSSFFLGFFSKLDGKKDPSFFPSLSLQGWNLIGKKEKKMGIGKRGILGKVVFPKFLEIPVGFLHFWGGIGLVWSRKGPVVELRSWEFSLGFPGKVEFLG